MCASVFFYCFFVHANSFARVDLHQAKRVDAEKVKTK